MRLHGQATAASAAIALWLAACSTADPDLRPPERVGPPAPATSVQPPDRRLAHCAPFAPLPAWAEQPAAHQVVAQCDSVEVRVDALEDGVVRLRYTPAGATPREQSWAVVGGSGPADPVRASTRAGALELCTRHGRVEVAPESCAVTVLDRDGRVLVADAAGGGFHAGEIAVDGVTTATASIARQTPAGERFYGFGEKTGPLDKRGSEMTFWNTDAYDPSAGGYLADQDPLYQSIPFFIALRDGVASGVFTDNPERLDMDMAKSVTDAYLITAHAESLDQYIIPGSAIAEVVRRYTALTGRTPLPPRWSLGYHQSRWGYSPDTAVEDLAQRFRDEGIPADALWLDIQHMDGFRTFTWDPNAFADPAGLVDQLREQGFEVVAIADPGIKVDPDWDVYQSGVAGDHFLRTAEGSIYEGVVWPGPAAFPDFTRPETRAWWGDLVGRYLDVGLGGIWLDVNEPTTFPESGGASVPDDVVLHGDGAPVTMARAHNAYALFEARATYDGMLARAPERRPFVLSRAGYAGIQRHAAVWTGDVVSDWAGLRGTLPMLLGMGLSGVPFVGSDVGGYSGNATPELFARWMALGSVSPFFRGHVTSGVPGQEPWEFGTEVRDISRSLISERYRLLPYWYSLFREAEATGAPVLRPLVYEFQDDPATHALGDQAMIGPWLLVAPILDEGASARQVYLPAGRWYEYYSGAAYDGPTTIEVSTTLAALPIFVREGAIVPRGPAVMRAAEASLDTLFLDLYPADRETTFALYEDAGDGFANRDAGAYSAVTYTLERLSDGARLTASEREGDYQPGARRLEIRLRRADASVTAVTLDGTDLAERGSHADLLAAGEGWWHDPDDLSIVVSLADRDAFDLRFFYDPALADLRPSVAVDFEVEVPSGTPLDTPVYIATSANGWTQQPLAWTADPNVARGTVLVPRGEWFFYKFTRGDWDTVEKWPDCEEATNRYRFGAALLAQRDTVYGWRDWCP